jgi:hypothetical protein
MKSGERFFFWGKTVQRQPAAFLGHSLPPPGGQPAQKKAAARLFWTDILLPKKGVARNSKGDILSYEGIHPASFCRENLPREIQQPACLPLTEPASFGSAIHYSRTCLKTGGGISVNGSVKKSDYT